MGIGKEVAEAYINVHGDVEPFRKDLEKAAEQARAEGEKSASAFNDAFLKRAEEERRQREDAIHDAFYSHDPIDWEKALGKFDPHSMDLAHEKITEYLNDQIKQGALTHEQFDEINHDILQAIDDRERYNAEAARSANLEMDHVAAIKEFAQVQRDQAREEAAATRLQDSINKAYFAAEREDLARNMEKRRQVLDDYKRGVAEYNKSFDGMVQKLNEADLESAFRKMAKAMKEEDFAGFAKNFDSFDALRDKVAAVTDEMTKQGRLSKDNSDLLHASTEQYITDEERRIDSLNRSRDAIERAKTSTDKWNESLDGRAWHDKLSTINSDFDKIAKSVNSSDWSHFSEGTRDLEDMTRRTLDASKAMHEMGRLSDEDYGRVISSLHNATTAQGAFNVKFKEGNAAASEGEGIFKRLGATLLGHVSSFGLLEKGVENYAAKLKGLAGINVLSDTMEEGITFIQHIDEHAKNATQSVMKLGGAFSYVTGMVGGLLPIVADVGQAIGGLATLGPAFATGLGIMVVIAEEALQGLAKQYKNQILKMKEDMLKQVMTGLDPAMDRFQKQTLPTLSAGMNNTAAAMGRLFGSILDGISASAKNPAMTAMFKRMDDAMDKSHAGVKSLVDAWVVLGDAGSHYFDRFAGWINTTGAQFDTFIKKAAKNGDLKKWIDDGITGLKNLWNSAGSIISIFNDITRAIKGAGALGLQGFADHLKDIDRMVGSAGFQKSLTGLFDAVFYSIHTMNKAIADIGPAVDGFLPHFEGFLRRVGSMVSDVISYIGTILGNPNFKLGFDNFISGLQNGIEALKPAIKPIADSLGGVLDDMGKIATALGSTMTEFFVKWAPVFDQFSIKFETLIQPFSNTIKNFIDSFTPVLKDFNSFIIGPVVGAIKNDLLPAINDFMKKFAPVIDSIVKDLGPPLTTLVKDVLPPLVTIVGELVGPAGKVVDLLSPTFNDVLKKIGASFKYIADAIKVLKGELPIGDIIPKMPTAEQLQTKWKTEDMPATSWRDIIAEMFTKDLSKGISDAWTQKIWPMLQEGVKSMFEGRWGFSEKGWKDHGKDFVDAWNKYWDGVASNNRDLSKAITNWIGKTLDDLGKNNKELSAKITKALNDWWGGIKGMFQDWMKSTFGIGGNTGGNDAKITGGSFGGGGAGGKGAGVMGKITDQMLGNTGDSKSILDKFFEGLNKDINTGIEKVKADIKRITDDIGKNWDAFWGGLGTWVQKAWDSVALWCQTKATEVKTNIGNFITDAKTNWDNFWNGLHTNVQKAWTAVSTWVSTKATEVKTNVTNFITTVKTNWDNFWNNLPANVQKAWNSVVTWVQTKIGETKTNINNFISTVKTNWDNFWNGLPGKVQKGWESIVKGINTGIDSALRWLGMLPEKARQALFDLPGKMKTAGNDAMQGFINGMNGMLGDIKSTAGALGAAALAAAKFALDSKSPSKKFITVGEDTGNGFIIGMGNKVSAVAAAAASMASATTSVFGKSKMFLAGVDAAQGLADGLAANKGAIAGSLSALSTSMTVGTSVMGKISPTAGTTSGDRSPQSAPAGGLTIASGAIQINTPMQNPDLLAGKVLDDLVTTYSNL